MTNPVNPDQLRISIEMGDEYQPSSRLRSALDELAAALAEIDAPEVEGFLGNFEIQHFKALTYDSLSSVGERGSIPSKIGNKVGEGVFKF